MTERMSEENLASYKRWPNCWTDFGANEIIAELDRARASEERLEKRLAELESREVFVVTPTTGGRREYDPITVGELRGIVREEIKSAKAPIRGTTKWWQPFAEAFWDEEPTDG